MTWNYRLVEHRAPTNADGSPGIRWVAIHEAYYHEDGTLRSITVDPVPIIGEDGTEGDSDGSDMAAVEARVVYDMIASAFTEPVITIAEVEALTVATERENEALLREMDELATSTGSANEALMQKFEGEDGG